LIEDFLPAFRDSLQARPSDAGEARRFFEERFRPFLIAGEAKGRGFVTGYYEPEIAVSETRTGRFRYPIHRRPDDLVDIDDTTRPPSMDPYFAFARQGTDGISEYPDRKAIDQGALDGHGLEIAYAEDKVDLFFVHIQGAARLVYTDGTTRRITYAAKTGHPFTAIGKILIERGEIDRRAVTMATIRAWLADHPDQIDALFWENRSYIFFREADVDDPAFGPIAAAKVPLSPGRSLAVDRLIHTFGTPFFVSAPGLVHLDRGAPFARLMLAQDTGSAIVGPARGDIFTGSGAAAGELAGSIKHAADFHILVPLAAAERLGQ
jgi:membrane-bound lytic murein transglycosylase A